MANYRQIEKILQSATPKQRATMIKQNGLDGAFDADGAIRAEKLRELGENVIDGQMDTQGENGAQGEGISAVESVNYSLIGVADDGKKIYEGNFPKGTPKSVKSEKILGYIQNVWSKKPITLTISNGETSRTIQAQFDPTIDETKNTPTDASKLAGGNRHGTSSEQRVTLDLADDYYEIASDAEYNYSKDETGKEIRTHDGVNMWHYFVNDIYFAEHGDAEHYEPYTVTINVKEKDNGEFVYSFNAEKEPSTRRTLHADVNTRKGANGELFLDNSIPQNPDLSTASGEKSSGNFDHRFMSPDLWRREDEVQREIAKISEDSGENISVLARDLTDEGKKQHTRLKKAFATLSEVSGGRLQMVVVEKNSTFTGAYAHGDTVYISADAIESGKWGEALIEESVHFTQGTQEHSLLRAFLVDDTELLAKIESELTKVGNDYGFTAEDAKAFRAYLDGDADAELTGRALRYSNELTAHMSAELLSNEAVIDRLVGRHATLAERILIKFRQLGRAFAKDKALAKRVADAEQIYLAAIERRGWKYENGKIVGADDEETDFSMDSQDGEIALGMSEKARYEVLKDKKITISAGNQTNEYLKDIQSVEELHAKAKSKAEKIIRPLARRLGIFGKSLSSPDVEIDFQFTSNGGLKESLNKQLRYGGSYADLAKVIVNLESVLETATLIEKHKDKYHGTERQDRNLEMVYVLLGAVRDGESIIPVQMEIKKHTVDGGRLYLTVALTKIEADVLGSAVNQNGQAHTLLSASEYSIADFVSKVNPADGHFLKYLPDDFLSKEQISSKRIALEEDRRRIEGYEKTYLRAKDDMENHQTTDDLSNNQPKKKSKTKAEVLEDNARLREEKKKANERAAERDDRELSPLYLLDVIDKNI